MLGGMSKVAVVVVSGLLGFSTIAAAETGPTMRFGLTGAISNGDAPGKWEAGPALGVGLRSGPFVGELEYAYLSFFDPDTVGGGVQRVGVSLRADVLRSFATRCVFRWGCTRAQALWVEGGAGERFGQWQLDAAHVTPNSDHQPEAHVSVGIEVDNQIHPMRNGFQLGVRLAVAPKGSDPESACRGSSCMPTSTETNSGGYATSVLVEWMFLFGN